MRTSLKSFGTGLILSVVLLYLILVAQFRSFADPLIILLAFPPGLAGAMLTLGMTRTTLNVMSLMGIVVLAGITMSDSILIVEFARHTMKEGYAVRDAAGSRAGRWTRVVGIVHRVCCSGGVLPRSQHRSGKRIAEVAFGMR